MVKTAKTISSMENLSIKATNWVGTPQSVLVHTILFVLIFALYFFGFPIDNILLILTTAVSLEAIYLAIFIQMTVNRNTKSLEEVEEDIEEIQEDVEGLEGEVDEISEDVDELSEDIAEDDKTDEKTQQILSSIAEDMKKLQQDLDKLKEKGIL
jgi:uncharacterized protein YoxC